MRKLKVVIGANYGDEGKGLTTAHLASMDYGMPLIVLSNGGAQRGHTVETSTGFRHVFSHFGSSFTSAATYMPSTYIVNPIVFCAERADLGGPQVVFANINCKVTTPYDMLFNRLMELNRGDDRHGSTGMGLWATIERHSAVMIDYHDLGNPNSLEKKLDEVVSWYTSRCKDLGLDVPSIYKRMFKSEGLKKHFMNDAWEMWNTATPVHEMDTALKHVNGDVIFENGQGLLLSDNPKNDHTTPSKTGIEAVNDILEYDLYDEIKWEGADVYYVTRPYLTRHGAGPLADECPVDLLNPCIEETTNVPNDWQGEMRYAFMDWTAFDKRVKADFRKFKVKGADRYVAMTHCNELSTLPLLLTNVLMFNTRYADQTVVVERAEVG